MALSNDCTVADVLNDAMSLLGDPDGEITQELVNDFGTAYSELISELLRIAAPEVTREVYYTLPANTNVVFPSQLGVSDFSEPQYIFERGNVNSVAITNVHDGTPIEITFATLPQPTDGRIEINGVIGVPAYLNRDWFITVTGTNTATLNGSVAMGIGADITNSGTAMWSSDIFNEVWPIDTQPFTSSSVPTMLGRWRWTDNAIYFPAGANLPRQLWIMYTANENPPASGTIGLVNGRELKFLSHATAAHFAPKRQLVMGPQLAAWAYGPSGQADSSGGFLRQLIVPILKQKQVLPRQSGKYRLRRGMVVIT